MRCDYQPGVPPCPIVLNELQSLSILGAWGNAGHLLSIIAARKAASLFIQNHRGFSESTIGHSKLGQAIRQFFNNRQGDRDMSISLTPVVTIFSVFEVAFRVENAQWQLECYGLYLREVAIGLDALQPVVADVQNLRVHSQYGQLGFSIDSKLILTTTIFQAFVNLRTMVISSFSDVFAISLLRTLFPITNPNSLPNLHELSLDNILAIPIPSPILKGLKELKYDTISIVETLIAVFGAWKSIGRTLRMLRLRECCHVKEEDLTRLSRITGGTVVIT